MANDLVISEKRYPALACYFDRLMKPRDMGEFQSLPLVPADALKRVKAELVLAHKPCDPDEAVKFSAMLVGAYPKHTIDEPAIYTRGIVSLFAEYPPSVAASAVDLLTRKCRFIPTRAEVFEECEKLMGKLRWAQFVADRTADEGKRRRQAFEDAAAAEHSRREFLLRHNGKSPLDVLRSKGLYSEREYDGKETNGGAHKAEAGGAGRPDKPRKAKRDRRSGDRNATGG